MHVHSPPLRCRSHVQEANRGRAKRFLVSGPKRQEFPFELRSLRTLAAFSQAKSHVLPLQVLWWAESQSWLPGIAIAWLSGEGKCAHSAAPGDWSSAPTRVIREISFQSLVDSKWAEWGGWKTKHIEQQKLEVHLSSDVTSCEGWRKNYDAGSHDGIPIEI